jgi:hypothetical protein
VAAPAVVLRAAPGNLTFRHCVLHACLLHIPLRTHIRQTGNCRELTCPNDYEVNEIVRAIGEEDAMDIIQGVAGILALIVFAKLLGFDIRNLFRTRQRSEDAAWIDDDPNSTMSVTRDVLAEKLEQGPTEFKSYTQTWLGA